MTWRHYILQKLYDWGFRGNLPIFISDFLTNRTFRARIGTTLSTSRTLENGVPQGSTLSVTLFIIAVNDLASDLGHNVDTCMYVDDLTIMYRAVNMRDINRSLQSTINKIILKAEDIGFKFSSEKTQCMHFCRLNRPHFDPMLYLKDEVIRCKNRVKFLGLIFDPKLTWKPHLLELKTKCTQALNCLKVLAGTKWGADLLTLLKVYQSIILSKIDYGCIVYSSAAKSYLKSLDPIHHAGIRYSIGAFPTTPTTSLCSESGQAPLHFRRKLLILAYICKMWAQEHHRNFKILFQENFTPQTLSKPLCLRAKELLAEIEYVLP